MIVGQEKNYIDQPYLEVTVKMDTLINPDIIYLDILLSERDHKNKISLEELESNFIETLKSLDINLDRQLTVSDFSSNFKSYFIRGKEIVKERKYNLKVKGTKLAGEVIINLENLGISNITIDKVEISNIDDIKVQLKSEAVYDAQIQAKFMAESINQNIGKAIHITSTYQPVYRELQSSVAGITIVGYSTKQQNEVVVPAIEFKPVKVEETVTVKFLLL